MGWMLLAVGLFVLTRLVGRLSRGDQRRPLSRPLMAETDRKRPSDRPNEVSVSMKKKPKGRAQATAVSASREVQPRVGSKQTKRSPMQWAREDWSRAIVMQEILGPPRALRPLTRKFPRDR
ncbi:hypothetical protein JQC72_03295 [Polycladomyces sp. WAk]|uniref:Uncharacterized protein n=1 Tax=Polycladomyces zharkentensis TaxID=2807616 RepID=A0ABS2WG73_9BACL|nr:hypothetical protein [Polycladomyces sp. WAk]MBN2908542.1 hypothetical protein [Polycladomyces sp. WAk]